MITSAPHGHILTNVNVWSPDGRWIVYDTRSDPAGAVFDGTRIERVNVQSGEVELLYESGRGACCGVATYSPGEERVVFIHGPEDPGEDWRYGPSRRRGVMVDTGQPGIAVNLDACDLLPPFTRGALRGGTHLHVFSPDGRWVLTYHDEVLTQLAKAPGADVDQRNIGISIPAGPVTVSSSHGRNHDGSHFSVLVTQTVASPLPGSDQISRAFEEAWVGLNGYARPDGTRQHRASAFQGNVVTASGKVISEAFVVDIPDDPTVAGDGPLQGTSTRRPFPPRGCVQRRLSRTEKRRYPGIQGPRHWLRSAADGSRVAFLMKDDLGVVQLWTISPSGGEPDQLTRNPWSVSSAFTWSPDGRWIAHVMDNRVYVTDAATGESVRQTARESDPDAPRPEACVFSPDGRQIAYVRPVRSGRTWFNQICVVTLTI